MTWSKVLRAVAWTLFIIALSGFISGLVLSYLMYLLVKAVVGA